MRNPLFFPSRPMDEFRASKKGWRASQHGIIKGGEETLVKGGAKFTYPYFGTESSETSTSKFYICKNAKIFKWTTW